MKTKALIVIALIILLSAAACAQNNEPYSEAAAGEGYGTIYSTPPNEPMEGKPFDYTQTSEKMPAQEYTGSPSPLGEFDFGMPQSSFADPEYVATEKLSESMISVYNWIASNSSNFIAGCRENKEGLTTQLASVIENTKETSTVCARFEAEATVCSPEMFCEKFEAGRLPIPPEMKRYAQKAGYNMESISLDEIDATMLEKVCMAQFEEKMQWEKERFEQKKEKVREKIPAFRAKCEEFEKSRQENMEWVLEFPDFGKAVQRVEQQRWEPPKEPWPQQEPYPPKEPYSTAIQRVEPYKPEPKPEWEQRYQPPVDGIIETPTEPITAEEAAWKAEPQPETVIEPKPKPLPISEPTPVQEPTPQAEEPITVPLPTPELPPTPPAAGPEITTMPPFNIISVLTGLVVGAPQQQVYKEPQKNYGGPGMSPEEMCKLPDDEIVEMYVGSESFLPREQEMQYRCRIETSRMLTEINRMRVGIAKCKAEVALDCTAKREAAERCTEIKENPETLSKMIVENMCRRFGITKLWKGGSDKMQSVIARWYEQDAALANQLGDTVEKSAEEQEKLGIVSYILGNGDYAANIRERSSNLKEVRERLISSGVDDTETLSALEEEINSLAQEADKFGNIFDFRRFGDMFR